jgi:hypothetical protein
MVKSSGGVGSFVQSILGLNPENKAPVGVSNFVGSEVSGGAKRKRRAASPPKAKKAAPKTKKAAPKAKAVTARRTKSSTPKNRQLVTHGGMNITPMITALLALGLRIANGDSLKSNKKTKGGGTAKKLKAGAPSLEHFVQSLQLGGDGTIQNASGTPFAFNSDGKQNMAAYDPSSLASANSLKEQKYEDILANNAVTKASEEATNSYLASASARGGGRKKLSVRSRSKSPVRKPRSGRKRRGGGEPGGEPEGSGGDEPTGEPTGEPDNGEKFQPLGPRPGVPEGPKDGGGRGRTRSLRKPTTRRSKSPAKTAKAAKGRKPRSKSPAKTTKATKGRKPRSKSPAKRVVRRRRGGNGNCSSEASDLII